MLNYRKIHSWHHTQSIQIHESNEEDANKTNDGDSIVENNETKHSNETDVDRERKREAYDLEVQLKVIIKTIKKIFKS